MDSDRLLAKEVPVGYVPPKGDDAVEDHYKRTMTKLGAHKSKTLSRSLFCGLWSIVVDVRSLLRPPPPPLFWG